MWGQQDLIIEGVAVSLLSLVLLAVTSTLLVKFLNRLPAEYFLVRPQEVAATGFKGIAWSIVRTLAGFVLMLVGTLMLFTPGPGIALIILGIVISDFRGKHWLLRKVVGHSKVFASLNWMRRRAGKSPFLKP